MYMIACVDDKGGMFFHGRRQSRDRMVQADILKLCAPYRLWMNTYSYGQFSAWNPNIQVDDHFLSKAAAHDFCFVEDQSVRPYLACLSGLILYRWNQIYPADLWLDIQPIAEGFRLTHTEEIQGYSHKRITKEVYSI